MSILRRACVISCLLVVAACSGQAPEIDLKQDDESPVQTLQTVSSETNPATPPLVTSLETQGPFHVANHTFTLVKQINKVGNPESSFDMSVEWWELRDGSGNAVYRKQYDMQFNNGGFRYSEDVWARELKTESGQGILLTGSSLPSAPGTGWWVQVFGVSNGRLVPFSEPISAHGEFLEEGVSGYVPYSVKGQQQSPVSNDVLKFRMWTGNFNIYYNVIIDWFHAGIRPELICSRRTAGGSSSSCLYPVYAKRIPDNEELTFVRLFDLPNQDVVPEHVVIKPESKIEFIEAQANVVLASDDQGGLRFRIDYNEDVWLRISIDGRDGWISGRGDFYAVGLPDAG